MSDGTTPGLDQLTDRVVATTPLAVARRFIGVHEVHGLPSNPLVLAMLRLDTGWVENDETPWCSAFVNFVCWILNLSRSHSLAARSWLPIGMPVSLTMAIPGFTIAVLTRDGSSKDPSVLSAPGHVGFYAGRSEDGKQVLLLGGNQGDAVSIAPFQVDRVIRIIEL